MALLTFSNSYSQNFVNNFHGITALRQAGIYSTVSGSQAVFNNPAALGKLKSPGFNAGIQNNFEISELSVFLVGAAIPLHKYGIVGLKLGQLGSSEYINQHVGLVYSMKLFEQLSIGIGFNLLHTRIREYGKKSNFTFEVGMLSQMNDKVQVAFHVFSPYVSNFSKDRRIPTSMSIGLVYTISKKIDLLAEIEKNDLYPFRIKGAISYQMFNKLKWSMGAFSDLYSANISSGFKFDLPHLLALDFGLQYNQELGLSSGIALEIQFE